MKSNWMRGDLAPYVCKPDPRRSFFRPEKPLSAAKQARAERAEKLLADARAAIAQKGNDQEAARVRRAAVEAAFESAKAETPDAKLKLKHTKAHGLVIQRRNGGKFLPSVKVSAAA